MAHEDIIRILLVDDVELVRHALRRSSRLINVSQLLAKPAMEKRLSSGSDDAILRWC
jgi:hypothetical protein